MVKTSFFQKTRVLRSDGKDHFYLKKSKNILPWMRTPKILDNRFGHNFSGTVAGSATDECFFINQPSFQIHPSPGSQQPYLRQTAALQRRPKWNLRFIKLRASLNPPTAINLHSF
ncbi:hypothetical protein DSO57_1037255 [Entomophthora muscae]|uniref:Uncharacterized protein n=2 Tax=Entomophthora muscae TaxID=34485 RepID=A0ACC2UJK6_9FUNG|nr:hypothetical protein DSO57_1008496 [Entomophthora muscae]KAJ9087033.1 hypothetical protein DSO57_1037255 [Entomophthora muscae]